MAKQLQLRRGTTAQHSTFTGAIGEVTVNTDNNKLIVHDGVTAGGHIASGGQFLGNAAFGSVMFTPKVVKENLTLPTGYNGLIVDSITFADGYSITVEDGATLKIV